MTAALGQSNVYVSDLSGVDNNACGTVGSPCKTIQYAVDSIALDGDTIQIDTGLYQLPAAVGVDTPVVNIPEDKSLSFIGTASGNGTRIDGDTTRRGFLMRYTGGTCPSGFGSNGISDSTVLYFQDLIVQNCHIVETCGNTTYAYGGGMRIDADSASKLYVTIEHCTFKNNRAFDDAGPNIGGRSASGGAVWIYGRRNQTASPADYSEAHINNCDFSENYADQLSNGGHGGALLLRDLDTASVTNSSFCDNYVYSTNADNGDLLHDRNAGGAICFYDLKNTSPGNKYRVDNCSFINNSATVANNALVNPSEGGAIFLTKGDVLNATSTANLTISNSNFYNNNVQTGIEHIDNNGGTIDTAGIGFNAYYAQFQVDLGEDTTLCVGDSHLLDGSITGATYEWSDGSTTPTIYVNATDTYSVTVTVGSCEVSDTIVVDFVSEPTIDLGMDTTLCGYDSIYLDASWPNSTYSWSNNSIDSAIWAGSGVYWVEVDNDGCTSKDTIDIDSVNLSPVNLGNDTTICGSASGNVLLDATQPGASYVWQDNSTNATFNVTQSGVYHVTVSKESCMYVDTINVDFQLYPVVSLPDSTTICPYETLALNATVSGAQYGWNSGQSSSIINVSEEALYIVSVDLNGCITLDSAFVDTIEIPPKYLGPDLLLCPDDVYLFDATTVGASSYLWHNGHTGPTYNGSLPGVFWVEVEMESCTVRDSIDVNYVVPPGDIIGDDINVCENQVITLTVYPQNLDNFLWSTGSTSHEINVTTPGIYSVTANKSGCPFNDTVEVTHRPIPDVNLGGEREACDGDTVRLDVTTEGATYSWVGGSQSPTKIVTEPGVFSVTVNLNECLAEGSVKVKFKDAPNPNLKDDIYRCEGVSHTFSMFKPQYDSYLWHNGSTDSAITVNKGDTIWVQVEIGGCFGSDTALFMHAKKPVINLGADTILCDGDELLLNAKVDGTANYEWRDKSDEPEFLVWREGIYHVTIRRGGCVGNDSITVRYRPYPNVELGNDTTICLGDSLVLSLNDSVAKYTWNDEFQTEKFTVQDSATVVLTGENYCGVYSDTMIVSLRGCECFMYIPNTFSPDDDGINEAFIPQFDCDLLDYRISIRDRWGRTMFESTDPILPWDGMMDGKPVEIGVYVYEVWYKAELEINSSSVQFYKNGTINIIR